MTIKTIDLMKSLYNLGTVSNVLLHLIFITSLGSSLINLLTLQLKKLKRREVK